LSIEDYAERTAQTRPAWEAMSGKQTNDPAKLARALLTVVDLNGHERAGHDVGARLGNDPRRW